jgi:hypothetical protein
MGGFGTHALAFLASLAAGGLMTQIAATSGPADMSFVLTYMALPISATVASAGFVAVNRLAGSVGALDRTAIGLVSIATIAGLGLFAASALGSMRLPGMMEVRLILALAGTALVVAVTQWLVLRRSARRYLQFQNRG